MNKISTQDIKVSVKDMLMVLHDMGSSAEESVSSIQTALIYNKTMPLEDCKTRIESIKKQEGLLKSRFAEIIGEDPGVAKYAEVHGHISRIAEDLGELSDLIDKKIRENILFSDRAANESMFLLQRLTEILRPATDMILARNIFLCKYVQQSQSDLSKMADEYATLHEERLIKGECQPVASSLYIGMLDMIKRIAWHAREITLKLSK